MLSAIALLIVLFVGAYFVVLAYLCVAAPATASQFLLGFASSARLHFVELGLRVVAGAAFILRAPEMQFEIAALGIGWGLVGTTAMLLCIPWRLHRSFARRTVPHVVRHLRPLGIASLALGVLILACAVAPLALSTGWTVSRVYPS